MAKNNDLEIVSTGRVTIAAGSSDASVIDPKYAKIVTGISSRSAGAIETSFGTGSFTGGSEKPNKNNIAPTLEDIYVISKGTYLNDKGETRAKLTIKVANSSGGKIKGVDAIISVPTTGGA